MGTTETDTAQDEPKGKKKGQKGSLIALTLGPVLSFGAAFGANHVLSQPPAPITQYSTELVTDTGPNWTPPDRGKTVLMDPIMISMDGKRRVLKLGLALQITSEELDANDPRLKDSFTTYLRAVDPDALSEPGFHVHMKRQLLHRAQIVMGANTVTDVLVTDFLITT